jgi:hypothetical protein
MQVSNAVPLVAITAGKAIGVRMKRRPCGAPLQNVSPGDALLVATQNVLAAHTAAIPISPHADIDVPPSGAVPAIDIDTHPGAPICPCSVAAPSADIDVDIGALLRPRPLSARTFVARAHLGASIAFVLGGCAGSGALPAAVLAASARIATLSATTASARTFLITLLDLQRQSVGADTVSAGRERGCMVSAHADGEHRRSGAQRQQLPHWTILVHRLAPAKAGAFHVNVEMELRLPC